MHVFGGGCGVNFEKMYRNTCVGLCIYIYVYDPSYNNQ